MSRECCDHDCDEGRDCPNRDEAYEFNPWWPRTVVALLLVIIFAIALTNEIAGLLSALFH